MYMYIYYYHFNSGIINFTIEYLKTFPYSVQRENVHNLSSSSSLIVNTSLIDVQKNLILLQSIFGMFTFWPERSQILIFHFKNSFVCNKFVMLYTCIKFVGYHLRRQTKYSNSIQMYYLRIRYCQLDWKYTW